VNPIPVVRQWQDFAEDRVHYNAQGHERLAQVILDRLRDHGARLDVSA
jgi:lysophospholipase L1-like esterase